MCCRPDRSGQLHQSDHGMRAAIADDDRRLDRDEIDAGVTTDQRDGIGSIAERAIEDVIGRAGKRHDSRPWPSIGIAPDGEAKLYRGRIKTEDNHDATFIER